MFLSSFWILFKMPLTIYKTVLMLMNGVEMIFYRDKVELSKCLIIIIKMNEF